MSNAGSAQGSPRHPPRHPPDDGANDNERHTDTQAPGEPEPAAQRDNWQAIFSPHHNAYYFYNTVTQETTWENPLMPGSSSSVSAAAAPAQDSAGDQTDTSASTSSHASAYTALQEAALAQGIDPSLAHLDPSLLATTGTSTVASVNPSFTAKFNARTGAFTRNDARDSSHLSEFERAKRMSEFYFDVDAWEKQRDTSESQPEEEGKKRKRPTKKDLERFKEQKRLKKIAKTAWLRQ